MVVTILTRICEQCGTPFLFKAWPSSIKKGEGRFCRRSCCSKYTMEHRDPESRRLALEHSINTNKSPESRAKRSASSKRMWQDPTYRENLTNKHRLLWQDPEFREMMIAASNTDDLKVQRGRVTTRRLLEAWKDPDYRAKMSQASKEYFDTHPEAREEKRKSSSEARLKDWQRPEYRELQKKLAKERWQDQAYVSKLMKALNASPNQVEGRIIRICEEHNLEFKYNGDFSLGVVLNGLIPDMVNVNGKKQVIEILGDYFHSPEMIGDRKKGSAEGKIEVYSELGFKCLILWESEIKSMSDNQIFEKIRTFSSGVV